MEKQREYIEKLLENQDNFNVQLEKLAEMQVLIYKSQVELSTQLQIMNASHLETKKEIEKMKSELEILMHF